MRPPLPTERACVTPPLPSLKRALQCLILNGQKLEADVAYAQLDDIEGYRPMFEELLKQ